MQNKTRDLVAELISAIQSSHQLVYLPIGGLYMTSSRSQLCKLIPISLKYDMLNVVMFSYQISVQFSSVQTNEGTALQSRI